MKTFLKRQYQWVVIYYWYVTGYRIVSGTIVIYDLTRFS